MDGRNLATEVIPKWSREMTLFDIAVSIPLFLQRYLKEKGYMFYGKFDINGCYEISNFNNMLVNTYICKIDNTVKQDINSENMHLIVLSDDCFVILEIQPENKNFGRVVFWSTLFALSDLQINKDNRAVCLNFYNQDGSSSTYIRLIIANVLFFKEALIKRMSNLKINIEDNKLVKGQMLEKRITEKDIMQMNIEQIEWHITFFKNKIAHKEINFYVINTFNCLIRKGIEFYSSTGDEEPLNVLMDEMRNLLKREDVQKVMKDELK